MAETSAHGGAEQLPENAGRIVEGEVRPGLAVDLGACCFQGVRRSFQPLQYPVVDRAGGLFEPHGDPIVREGLVPGRRQCQPVAGSVPFVRAGEDVEAEFQVLDVPRHRSGNGDVRLGQGAWRSGNLAERRHDAIARLVAEDAAGGSRTPDRTADVAAELERREAGGESGRGTSGRAARRPFQVPWVVRLAEHVVVALRVACVDRQVRLAEDDGAGRAQPGDRHGVDLRNVAAQFGCAGGRAHPDGLKGVLDRHRDAVERAQVPAVGQCPVRGVRLPAGPLDVERDNGVERRVQTIDAVEEEFEVVAGGDPAAANR